MKIVLVENAQTTVTIKFTMPEVRHIVESMGEMPSNDGFDVMYDRLTNFLDEQGARYDN